MDNFGAEVEGTWKSAGRGGSACLQGLRNDCSKQELDLKTKMSCSTGYGIEVLMRHQEQSCTEVERQGVGEPICSTALLHLWLVS